MKSQMSCVIPFEKPVDLEALPLAMTAFFNVWNMVCPHCALWVKNSLLKLDGVLIVDVFFKQAVAAVSYDPQRLTSEALLSGIRAAGLEISHYYGGELIGHEPAVRALHLQQSENVLKQK